MLYRAQHGTQAHAAHLAFDSFALRIRKPEGEASDEQSQLQNSTLYQKV